MGLKVGELFVDMGIQGSEKTLGAITGVRSGLQSTSNVAFETKAALLGAMYAVQQLFAASNRTGTELSNFSSLLGVSAQTLQKYQYAARQVGVSNQEMEGTFKSIQAQMTKTLMGEGAPKGLARVAQLTGGMGPEDIKKFAEAPNLLIQKLQEYAQKENNIGLRNEVLRSFGVGDGVAAAMAKNAFTPEIMAKAPTYSDGEIKALEKAGAAWANLGNKIEMAIGRFNAKHGGDLVKNIDMIATKVLGLADAFVKVAEKLKLFELVGDAFKGWALALEEVSNIADDINAGEVNKSATGFVAKGFWDEYSKGVMKSFEKDENGKRPYLTPDDPITAVKKLIDAYKAFQPAVSGPRVVSPTMPAKPGVPAGAQTIQNINIQQTQHFKDDGTDPRKAADAQKQGVRDAYKQMPSQIQGN